MTTEIQQQPDVQQIVSVKKFLQDADPTQPERIHQEEEYAGRLESALQTRTDIVVDFSCLKTCLDPLNEPSDNQDDQQQFDYKEFVYDVFDNHVDKLSLAKSLVVRSLECPSNDDDDDQIYKYARLCFGMLQLSSLTELDLSGNKIHKTMQAKLQLWNLQNLKKVNMDNTSLTSLHASVGRLRKLEVLSLNKNQLSTLPVTIGYCENLRVLNLQRNKFRQLPGVLLKLKKLEEVRRLDNPLTPRYDMQAPQYVKLFEKSPPKDSSVKYNPQSLQMLCTKKVISSQMDYWQQTTLGPLQCKTLDSLAAEFATCEHCNAAISNPGRFTVEVMLVSFLGLSGVPFLLEACCKECQDNVKDKFGKMNVELGKKLDQEYDEQIKQAQRQVDRNEVDISPEAINAPDNQVEHFNQPNYRANDIRYRRRHHKKCTIM